MACAICRKPAFIFTHIPKTGGTSFMSRRSPVYSTLMAQCNKLRLMGGHKYLRSFGTGCSRVNLNKFFKFSIVRNPYDRFISLWLTKNFNGSLGDFIHAIERRKLPWFALKPQATFIGTIGGVKLLTDHLIRYENYKEGINETMDLLDLPHVKLPHYRKTTRNPDYRGYYKNQEQIDFVTKQYAIDLEHFNYEY